MGMEAAALTFLPFDGEDFSHTIIPCDLQPELFERVRQVEIHVGRSVPKPFWCHLARENGRLVYGPTSDPDRRETMNYVRASDLSTIEERPKLRNTAVWAYLDALPPDTRIAIAWGVDRHRAY